METSTDIDLKKYITDKDVASVLKNYGVKSEDMKVKEYNVRNASSKMLGLLADYWKLRIVLENGTILQFFVKALSRTNAGKAELVRDLKMFEKEVVFYSEIKAKLSVADVPEWSPRMVTLLGDYDMIVLEDLDFLNYTVRHKFLKFDIDHTIQALKTLARFHASSIIYEEKRSKEIGRVYTLFEEFENYLGKAGYNCKTVWYQQCMNAALAAIKKFSNKFSDIELKLIEERWQDVVNTGVNLSGMSAEHRNVICHRDMWNNNFLFHYTNVDNKRVPDSCRFVDFQALRYQPPAGDIMMLLCDNLDREEREGNLETFVSAYLEELKTLLNKHNIDLDDIMPREKFDVSIEQQREFGLITFICLMPLIWISDELVTEIAQDTEQFNKILLEDRVGFTNKLMEELPDFKKKLLPVFEEYAERYCLKLS